MSTDSLTWPVAIVSGSGFHLEALLDRVTRRRSFDETPTLHHRKLHAASTLGHMGHFVHGVVSARPVILQSGRLHLYEGLDYPSVTATVDALYALGARTVLFTNAAGGLLREMQPGDLLAVRQVRLFGPQRPPGTSSLRVWPAVPNAVAPSHFVPGCEHEGAYVWTLGPNYETRAEIAALQRMGGAAIGMSTAPELVRCNELGLQTAVVSCITNNCCDPQVLTHEHVLESAARASDKIVALLHDLLGPPAALERNCVAPEHG